MKNPIDSKQFPNIHIGFQYAIDVKLGKRNVPETVILAVNRFFKDIEITKQKNPPFFLNWKYAERAMRLMQKFQHAKGGNWKSKYILFEPWQKFDFTYMLGFMNSKTKRRRFRTAYVQVPRGSGKSAIASQIGLYMLALDGEVGADVYCASTKKEAARIVLDSARVMASKNSEFLKATGTKVLAHHIEHKPSFGSMRAVSSDTSTSDGYNGNCIIADETHQWKRELYDVLDSSLSKRDDSLFFMISTAGFNLEGIGYEIYAYSKKVLKGEVKDDTWFSSIYEMDDKDDWQDPEVWKKVNPNWGVSVDPINFEAKAKKAAETPASQANFLVKHLNKWQTTHHQFFSMEKWDECEDKSLKLEDFLGNNVYIGLDLSSKIDLTNIMMVFKKEDKYYIFDRSYLPEARIEDTRNVQYLRWKQEGYLNTMTGEVIDFTKIQDEIINDLDKKFKITACNVDPWSANETLIRLQKANINVYEFRMTVSNMSEPMKKLDALIRDAKLVHNGSPLLRWCISNVVAKVDANNNVFPRKEHDRLKIDLAVALIMAIGGVIYDKEQERKASVYNQRRLRFL